MKLSLIGTAIAATIAATAFAQDPVVPTNDGAVAEKAAAKPVGGNSAISVQFDVVPAPGGTGVQPASEKMPTAAEMVAAFQKMPAKKRAEMKTENQGSLQQIKLVKGLIAVQGKADPVQTEQIAAAEKMMNKMVEFIDLVDKLDATTKAGDAAKTAEATKTAEASAAELIKLQEKLIKLQPVSGPNK